MPTAGTASIRTEPTAAATVKTRAASNERRSKSPAARLSVSA
jgi:hypothetical protein